MKLLIIMVLLQLPLFALPNAPKPHLKGLDYASDGAVGIARVLDYTSTRAFLNNHTGSEVILPQVIVDNPPLFITFEGTVTGISGIGEWYMVRWGHRDMGRALQFIQAGVVLGVDVHNYQIAGRKVKYRKDRP